MTGSKGTSNNKDKSEIQGFLHCATDDETVRRFGRDDVFLRRYRDDAFVALRRLRFYEENDYSFSGFEGEVALDVGSVAVEDGGDENVAFGTAYVVDVVGEVEEDLDVLGVEAASVREDAVGGVDLVDAAGVEGGMFAAQHEQATVEGEQGVG